MKFLTLFEDGTGAAYHVTYTAKVPSILKKGLQMMHTSNWAKAATGQRYGSGEIYAFEDVHDALRWAAKMDWEFNGKMGSGKISVVKFVPSGGWEEDPVTGLDKVGAKGRWIRKVGGVPPEDILRVIPLTQELVKQVTGAERAGGAVADAEAFLPA